MPELKTYTVTLPIVGVAYTEVEAENEEDAIEKGLAEVTMADIENWEAVRQIMRGNYLYADINEASAKEETP